MAGGTEQHYALERLARQRRAERRRDGNAPLFIQPVHECRKEQRHQGRNACIYVIEIAKTKRSWIYMGYHGMRWVTIKLSRVVLLYPGQMWFYPQPIHNKKAAPLLKRLLYRKGCKPGFVPPSLRYGVITLAGLSRRSLSRRRRRPFIWDGHCCPPRATYPGRGHGNMPGWTRKSIRAAPIWSCVRRGLPCRLPLPETRCALTAPFHPCFVLRASQGKP